MTQLKTSFAGLSLRNPVIISSSSLTNSAEKTKVRIGRCRSHRVEICF